MRNVMSFDLKNLKIWARRTWLVIAPRFSISVCKCVCGYVCVDVWVCARAAVRVGPLWSFCLYSEQCFSILGYTEPSYRPAVLMRPLGHGGVCQHTNPFVCECVCVCVTYSWIWVFLELELLSSFIQVQVMHEFIPPLPFLLSSVSTSIV